MYDLPVPIKGQADWRQYRALRLENGVTCLVINDKESKTTGMACVVNAGAAADPRSLSGLAHFTEHMCFLGSEKYPGENEYKRYLSAHGGRSNASTSMQLTNYKFEVLADHAETAVDIFSNFFIAPLFTASGTSREVQAVDSENSKNLTADARRRLQILKDMADPQHYYSKFSTGNQDTLNTKDPEKLEWIRMALLAFHKKHYRPDNMIVVIAGPQSLDTLQEWVVSRYSQIPVPNPLDNQQEDDPEESDPEKLQLKREVQTLIDQAAEEAPPNTPGIPPPPYQPAFSPVVQGGTWPVLLTTKPLRSMRKLVLMWPMPPSDKRYPDQSPSMILSHLLGHEGAGSCFAMLQNRGWVSRLSAGPRTRSPDFSLFQVDMALTEAGEKNWTTVVDIVFEYCRMVQEEAKSAATYSTEETSPMSRIWGEMSRLDQLFFHQTSPGGVYSYAPTLAERIVSYGTEKVLSAGSMLQESEATFPLNNVIDAVAYLHPSNCFVERCSGDAWTEAEAFQFSPDDKDFGLKKEPWYGVEYYLSKISPEVVASWEGTSSTKSVTQGELHLPRPNQYIPRTLDLCPDLPEEAKHGPRLDKPIDPPTLLVKDSAGRLFHRLDDRYGLPQSSLNLLFRCPSVQHVKKAAGKATEKDYWEYDSNAALMSSMIAGIFNESMAQETYDADLAGLYWSLHMGPSGMKLACFGFSDRLPDLALKLLDELMSGEFLEESYFNSTKDRTIRGLKTYFESRRADSHAVYYRDALLASNDQGIDDSLAFAEKATLQALKDHLQVILSTPEVSLECLFSGNVSAKVAKSVYFKAASKVRNSQTLANRLATSVRKLCLPAGIVERRVNPGEDVELHFASKNPQEENGAVICSYQSSIPSFKGRIISHELGLHSTASIRLLCHMLREPLFDDLRTKQQLGYVVSAYYEVGYSSRQEKELASLGPLTTPVDFITVAILSRKLPPTEIVSRIDEFMVGFRESLVNMPDSEIRDHADALSTKLLKPIQKLQTETSDHFAKIQRYAPELFYRHKKILPKQRGAVGRLPWDSVKDLAREIQTLRRSDLLATWDRMTQESTRCRIVSCVYGNTFPLTAGATESTAYPTPVRPSMGWNARHRVKIVNNFDGLLSLRKQLEVFDDKLSQRRRISAWFARTMPTRGWSMLRLGCMLGVGVVGLSMAFRYQQKRSLKSA
eukprot:Nitzschia sp. Nitz4//scaffold243_size29414//11200//15047//NITZ4_008058-RA/size29414-augustus-gene-0.12-mRNA-1//1//CDS//3329543837//5385//frame0